MNERRECEVKWVLGSGLGSGVGFRVFVTDIREHEIR